MKQFDRTSIALLEGIEGIGGRIAKARKSRRWTQARLAKALGVPTQTVVQWENGRRKPMRLTMCAKICAALRRSADRLLFNAPRSWVRSRGEKKNGARRRRLKTPAQASVGVRRA